MTNITFIWLENVNTPCFISSEVENSASNSGFTSSEVIHFMLGFKSSKVENVDNSVSMSSEI